MDLNRPYPDRSAQRQQFQSVPGRDGRPPQSSGHDWAVAGDAKCPVNRQECHAVGGMRTLFCSQGFERLAQIFDPFFLQCRGHYGRQWIQAGPGEQLHRVVCDPSCLLRRN